MLKRGILKLAVAAIMTASALGLTSLGGTAFAATSAHPATTAAGAPANVAAGLVHTTSQTSIRREAASDTTPDTCTYGSSSGNVQTCFQITSTGSNGSMTASACAINSERSLHIQIIGLIFNVNSLEKDVYPGGKCLVFTISGYVPAGAYTAITWRYDANINSYTNIGQITLYAT